MIVPGIDLTEGNAAADVPLCRCHAITIKGVLFRKGDASCGLVTGGSICGNDVPFIAHRSKAGRFYGEG